MSTESARPQHPGSTRLSQQSAAGRRHCSNLLLGMHAHTGFDLGPAAVEVAVGGSLEELKRPFDEWLARLGLI